MTRSFRVIPFLLGSTIFSVCFAQSPILTCNATATPPIVHGEGLTERVGDIVLNCSGGAPNAAITGNFSVFLNVNITNHVAANTLTDVIFTIDTGAGPQPVSVPGILTGPSALVYNGVSFNLSATGSATLRLANLRGAASQLMLQPNAQIVAFLGFNSSNLVNLTSSQLTVGTVQRSFLTSQSEKIVCSAAGSPVPGSLSFTAFVSSGALYASTRITEGFGDAFMPRSGWPNLNADTGQRFLIRYSGFPSGAQIFVPNVVAGSDALQPTGGGDFGVPASGGQYAPSANGTLLLALVPNADANGAGGTPIFTPTGLSGSAAFDSLSQLPLNNGSAYAVYEVVDANPNVLETAQFPTFLGLAPNSVTSPVTTSENVYLAPISTIQTASSTAPIPRYIQLSAPSDCSLIGDCSANYFPSLLVQSAPITITAQAGSQAQVAYVPVRNQGGGVLNWTATVSYQSGSAWVGVDPSSGTNNGTIRLDIAPGQLPPGTYQATLMVTGASVAGAQTVPITLVVTAAPPPQIQPPVITGVVNAASFAAGPVVPGSLATIQGSKLSGSKVSVSFDGATAQMLYSSAQQINVLVPASLTGKATSQVIVTADGNASSAMTVNLASMAPAIFPGAVLNQDFSQNGAANPAMTGSVLQIFATGLSGSGAITAQIHDRTIEVPYYGGPAPGLVGVQQVDLVVPQDLPSMTTNVYVCGNVGNQRVCSTPAPVTIQQANP